jgi:tRNA threonylcarbamoyladenosine biosynthesis protein TsaB
MNILGIDTSTKFLCIGLRQGSGIYDYRLNLGRGHESFLLPAVERILDILKIKPGEIDYLAVGLGPGSFTGARIGLSTVKGMALALNKKVIGISSLDTIAYNAINALESQFTPFLRAGAGFICPVVDAKRELVYTSLYRNTGNGLKRVAPYRLIPVNRLLKLSPRGTIFLGDALRLYRQDLEAKIRDVVFLDEDFYYPEATNLIKLACARIEEKKFDDVNKLRPIYLYPKECQIRNPKSKIQNPKLQTKI